jgi:hypothetical protein
VAGREDLALVIGEEERAVCEGFPPKQVSKAISAIHPAVVVLVGKTAKERGTIAAALEGSPSEMLAADTLTEGGEKARSRIAAGSLVLAVKTWR